MESEKYMFRFKEWRGETTHLGYKNGEWKPHIKNTRMESGNHTFKIQECRVETAHLGYKNGE
ncbi:hypothetical protein DPMN_099587 [Dreissena polymorpha]|uniref:Uncharacterized protein n=1 Tax=Dreissena polymorpha TaxID=45954 RepID=A0A9D4LF58_DREPO|nr:hypothetical protein DPMN_099587 [Dreissena polymorpha]